ncbi:MAG: amidohydrolase family protein [Salinivirgaceae bacterium]
MIRKIIIMLTTVLAFLSCSQNSPELSAGQNSLEDLKLKDYRPKSIYKVPKTSIEKPAFPIIDIHSHDYAQNAEEIDEWVKLMDKFGIEKTVILSMQTGKGYDSVRAVYSKYPDRFEIWCGIDYTGYNTDTNWTENAIKELERCHKLGAKGVGELGDKGEGLIYSKPTKAYGLHIDDKALEPIWSKCAELGMPVNIHVAEPIWMYAPIDSTNDGLMNGYTWHVDLTKEGILDHGELMKTLDNALANNPKTTFIACHFANCSYDLQIIGNMLDKHPNLWADISARYAETAPIPKYMKEFYKKYQDRLLYGTDNAPTEKMYMTTFRILESEDEHFYETEMFNYHWPLYGFGLPKPVLEKLYQTNALRIQNTK